MILSIAIMARAHEESQTKAKQLLEAREKKRATAAEKVVTARVPAWLEVVDGRVVVIADRAEIVRSIFRETAAGVGRRIVVKRLNAETVPPLQGKRGCPLTS